MSGLFNNGNGGCGGGFKLFNHNNGCNGGCDDAPIHNSGFCGMDCCSIILILLLLTN